MITGRLTKLDRLTPREMAPGRGIKMRVVVTVESVKRREKRAEHEKEK